MTWDGPEERACSNCGKPIFYSISDVVYLHSHLEWGSDWFKDDNYNNRYYCDETRTKAAR